MSEIHWPEQELKQWILRVNRENIRSGQPNNPKMCPISLALQDHDKRMNPNTMINRTIITNSKEQRESYENSDGIMNWIRAFDSPKKYKTAEPITIIVDPVFYRLKLINEATDTEKQHHTKQGNIK